MTYARLYWGGNLLAGEQKPAEDDGRVLIAEPGGQYKELLADTVVGHRAAGGGRRGRLPGLGGDHRPGPVERLRTVDRRPGERRHGEVQVRCLGRLDAGGGVREPGGAAAHLSLWDGFDSLDGPAEVRLNGLGVPRGAGGRVGLMAYNGDRGGTGDSLTYTAAGRAPTPLGDPVNPADDVLNSTINDPGRVRARREPAYDNTLGYDSDVFDLGTGLAQGGDQLTFRLVSQRDAAWAGALFAAVDVQ